MRCAANHYRSLASGTSARMLPFCLVRSCNVHRGLRTGSPRSRYAHQSKRSQHCEHLTLDPEAEVGSRALGLQLNIARAAEPSELPAVFEAMRGERTEA